MPFVTIDNTIGVIVVLLKKMMIITLFVLLFICWVGDAISKTLFVLFCCNPLCRRRITLLVLFPKVVFISLNKFYLNTPIIETILA